MKTKENNYIILKTSDIQDALCETEKHILNMLIDKVRSGRPKRSYYVCNTDEPYAKKVLQVILEGEETKRGLSVEHFLSYKLSSSLERYLHGERANLDTNKSYCYDFSLMDYPLLGTLETNVNKLIDELVEVARKYGDGNVRWDLADVELFRDTETFQDLYTGKLLLERTDG